VQNDLRETELFKRMQHPAIADYGVRVVSWFQEHMPA
jgi:hypothetical protein